MTWNRRWTWILILLLGIALVGACTPLYPTPKKIVKGTSTPTPFLPQATFTLTPVAPPTAVRASSMDAAPLPSQSPSNTDPGTGTPTERTPSPTSTPSRTASTPTPSKSPTLTLTVAPTNTPQADEPVIEVSVTTNCRAGPGLNYARVGSLYPNQTAALIARHATLDYWVIELPSSGATCWLWGYYANPSGSYDTLPVYTPPPSPTLNPTGTFTPTETSGWEESTPTSTPSSTLTPTNTTIPPTPTAGSPPPPSPTGQETDTPQPSLTPTPPPPTPTFTPVPTQTSGESEYCSYTSVLSGEEQQIKSMINDARADHGLPPLRTNWNLKKIARDHGRDMTCNGLWSHTSSDGTKAWERISMALGHGPNWCYNHCCCAEIFYGGSNSLTPKKAFKGWMTHESQDPNYDDNIHKRTILSPYSTDLGVGVIYYKKGSTERKFYTVDFARP